MAITDPASAKGELPANRKAVGKALLERIGNTPLLRLGRVGSEFPNIQFFAKAEWFNPGGSVKDRPALSMIRTGLEAGKLVPGKTIVDATSGNTGIAYAMIGAALGYPVKLYLPHSASHERKRILVAYGAELVMTPGDERTDGAIRRVRELVQQIPKHISILTSTAIPQIGRRITARPRMRSGNRRAAKLRTLWRLSARAEHLSA